jgi:hypothetical protein
MMDEVCGKAEGRSITGGLLPEDVKYFDCLTMGDDTE